MLGTLMKYEFKATGRVFLPLYGLLIIAAIAQRLIQNGSYSYRNTVASSVIMSVQIALLLAVFVVTLVIVIRRFRENLLGDEGYLMFTLPVKTSSLIGTKLWTSFIWVLLSGLVATLSLFLIGFQSYSDINIFDNIYEPYRRIFIETGILCLISVITCILQIYFSMTVGNFGGRHRILLSFAVFLGIWILESVIFTLIFHGLILNVLFDGLEIPYLARTANQLLVLIICSGGFAAAFYGGTYFILSRHLNLE